MYFVRLGSGSARTRSQRLRYGKRQMIRWYTEIVIPRLLKSEDGPTAVEYAVIIALIVVTCIGSVQALATATRASLDHSSNAIQSAL